MARPSNKDARRRQIVLALEQVMATSGYERASIGAIAETAGLAQGLVHYHFSSKQAILVELVRDLGERLSRRQAQAAEAAGDDPLKRLHAWLDAHVALGPGADPTAVACWVAIGAESIRQPEVQHVYLEALEREKADLIALLSPLSPADSHESIAAALLAAIQGAYLLGTAAPTLIPPGFAAPALRCMLRGLLPG